VNVLDKTPLPAPAADDAGETDPEEKDGKKAAAGAPHVLVVTTPDARLRLLLAMASRRKAHVGAGIPAAFTGYLMTDGYAGYQHLLDRIAGIQQCCQHVIRRCRAVAGLGPGSLQSWAEDIIAVLAEAHRAVEDARARGDTALDPRPSMTCGNATTRPPRTASSTTGSATGPAGTTPDTPLAAGCATTRSRPSCSPATSTWTGPTIWLICPELSGQLIYG